MARFYASIRGNRGEATRMGTPASGIEGHVRGWNVGVRVEGRTEGGMDYLYVYATGGSNGSAREQLIAVVKQGNGGLVEVRYNSPGMVGIEVLAEA